MPTVSTRRRMLKKSGRELRWMMPTARHGSRRCTTRWTGWVAEHKNVVLACSALKRSYRDELCIAGETKFVYLKGSYDLIDQRLRQRHGHFASETILASQFAALEEPDDAITVDIDRSEADRRRNHAKTQLPDRT